jgi:peptidoglycan/xylan/chitin deacetylase (PgdA/CDA1 family)
MMRMRAHGLMHHDVVGRDYDASGRTGAGPDRYKLSWERFLEHLERIAEVVGVPPVTADDLVAGIGPSPRWSLTFDDGGASAVQVGEELLRRSWRAHFFVTTDLIGSRGFVDAEAIRELDRIGHVVGSHSVTHPEWMASLPAGDLLREWADSVERLREIIGQEVCTASVPGGHFRRKVAAAAASAGITTLFTSEPVRTAYRVGGCLVVGRYSVRRDTSADAVARAAAGEAAPWLRQYVAWNVRKPVKLLGAKHYDRIRRKLLPRPSPEPPR